MALKSVLTIDTDDSSFKAFKANFDKYEAALKKMPGSWGSVGKETKATASQFDRMTAALLAQAEMTAKVAKAEKETERTAKSIASSWTSIAHSTKSALGNVTEISRHILKWSAYLGGGLLGGGLWGLDKLGQGVASRRQSSIGLGMSSGEERAFGLDYGRFVNPGSFLSGVSAMRADPTLGAIFSTMGMTQADLQGDTAQVAVRFLDRLRQFAKNTPDSMLGTYANAYDLGEVGVGAEQLRALKYDKSFGAQSQRYPGDVSALGLDSDTQLKWQNFTTQLTRAGQEIETVFVRNLVPLTKPIADLSGAFEKAVAELLNGPVKRWIPELAHGLQIAADYLSGPRFEAAVKTFIDDFEDVVDTISDVHKNGLLKSAAHLAFGSPPPAGATGDLPANSGWAYGPPKMSFGSAAMYAIGGQRPVNNPLDLRVPGSDVKFQQFATMDQGWQAAARQLQRYQDKYHLDTIAGIENRWEPYADKNDTAAHIKEISKMTGYDAGQHLNLHDLTTLSNLLAAKGFIEHSIKPNPQAVYNIIIENNTGGNSSVVANQLPQ